LDRAVGTDDLGELVKTGTGQASLTLKGFDFDGGTDLTVSDVDAVTLTSYQSSSVLSVGVSSYGDVEADDADTVTATMAGTTAALAGSSLTIASLSADGATAINLNAGSFNTLAITGDVTSTSESLDTMAIVVSDDGTLTANEIRTTGSEMTSATITLGVASTLTITGEIDLESVEDVTITVGAASTLTADDLVMGGDVVINATMGSNIGVDTFGVAGMTGTFDINGRGNLGAQTLVGGVAATKTLAIAGITTLNIAGYTDTTGGTITINAGNAGDKTFVGNNQATSITTGAGDDSITGGSGIDTIVDSGAGDDVLNLGAGNDIVTDAGAGDDSITLGAGNDTVTTAGAGDDTINAGEGTDDITGGAGSDAINLTETTSVTDIVRGFVTANQSTVASADTWTAAGNVAGETITFATGTAGSVDTIAGFVSGVDDLDVTNAATAPTTLIGIAEAAALVDGTVYVAYGTYNATTGVFTTAAAYDATTAHDALLVEGDGAQTIVNEQDYVILTGLNQALVAGDFI
jgi:hypothetical protein